MTIAPETGSDRLRRVINKTVTNDEILAAAEQIFASGMEHLKLYFMLGLPGETDEDLVAIRDLTLQLKDVMMRHARGRGQIGRIVGSVNPLVPKPGTAYQWLPMEDDATIERKIRRMRTLMAGIDNVYMNIKSERQSFYQALLSLGDIHFCQGDGEVCAFAIETHGQARIRVEVLRDVKHVPAAPLIESSEPAFRNERRTVSTIGLPIDAEGRVHPMDTTLAARNAVAQMIDWLGAEAGLAPEPAYALCSAAVDLRISEIVDVPHPVVSALCPLDIFHEIREQRG